MAFTAPRDRTRVSLRWLARGGVAVFLLVGSALAADPPAPDRRLKELEDALEQGHQEQQRIDQRASQIAREIEDLQASMVASARAVQEHEDSLSDLEQQLSDLNALEKDKSHTLELRRQQMSGVLAALERLAFRPSEALIAQPTSPADTVRSAILLRTVVPKIQESAKALKTELDSLTALRTDIAQQKQKISAEAGKLDGEHKRLTTLYDRKKQFQQETLEQRQETTRRLQAMAAEAEDLKDLIARLEAEAKRRAQEAAERAAAEKAAREAERAAEKAAHDAQVAAAKAAREAAIAAAKAEKERKAQEIAAAREARKAEEQAARVAREAQAKADQASREAAQAAASKAWQEPAGSARPFAQAEGMMPFPARGRVTVRFGQTTESGVPARGITIATRPSAQVVSPHEGQVVFAGPFRGYGLLLIIEHGEGYHTLLAGMARIDSNVGQHLLPGEPVGVMGQAESAPFLYVELRHNGQPLNPLPWFTARKTKVSG